MNWRRLCLPAHLKRGILSVIRSEVLRSPKEGLKGRLKANRAGVRSTSRFKRSGSWITGQDSTEATRLIKWSTG
jgi:hypothetical protein